MMNGGGMSDITMGGFGWLFMLLSGLILIIATIYLLKIINGGTKGALTAETVIDVLKKRYVNGEINKEEYEEISRIILKQ